MTDLTDLDKQLALTTQGLQDHTKSCDERYAIIAAAMLDLKTSVKEVRNWLISVAAAVFLIMISMLGFLAVNYIKAVASQSTQHTTHDSLQVTLGNLV